MPRICTDGGAADPFAGARDGTKERLFHNNDDDEHNEGEWGRRMVRRDNFLHALDRECNGRGDNDKTNDDCRDGFRFAVTVGMFGIGRCSGQFQAEPNDERAKNIESRFDSIGDQHVTVADEPRGDLRRGQQQIDNQSEERETRSGRQLVFREAGCRAGHNR